VTPVAQRPSYQCEVTQAGLTNRAAPYGGDISKLPPPDSGFQPGDRYTSVSGCASGDRTIGSGGAASGSTFSPVLVGALIFVVVIIAAVAAFLIRERRRRFNPYAGSRA
jgi:hypothetical protein